VHGTESNPIVVKGDTPTGHTIRGDSTNIFQLRVSSHFVLEDLNIIGEVENIPLQDAWDHRFDYKIEGDDTVYQRADPSLSAEEIEVMTFDDISTLTVIRPSYYTTNGLLVQSSRYVTVRNCQVSFAPGTGLRVQSSDYVTVEDNTVHNNSRRSSVGNHGMVIHSVTNNVGGVTINDEGYRIHIVGNTVYSNYNEVYSWSELKTFITPHIDEGKGITIQKTDEATFDNGTGRILIANNVVYSNGFSGVHTNFATKVDIYHNTAVENSFTGDGVNVGISVSDSSKVNVMNNVALSTNTFGGFVYNTDADDLVASEIVFASNVAVGNLSSRLNAGDFIITNAGDLGLQGAPDYRLASNTPVAGQGSSAVLTAIPLDKDGVTRANPPDPGAYEILGVSTAVPSTQNSQAPSKSSATTAPSSIPSKIASQLPSAFPSGKPSKLPTMSPTDAPFATPSLAPVFVPTSSCVDSPLRVMANGAARSCVWVAKNTESRCTLENVASHCPVTCNACSSNQCSDSAGIFVLENGLTKPCDWVARSNTSERCALEGVEDTCRQTCGSCVGSTVAPAATPSAAPVSVSSGSCVDSPLRMMVDGRSRSCVWVARTNTESRCALENVASHCPVTCNACSSNQCSDSSSTFVLENGLTKPCDWVARLNTSVRCALEGVEDTCRQTCGTCTAV
jgi:parallel beta-helix repeat protein